MIMEHDRETNVQRFLTSKNINLTIDSEVLLAYPREMNGIMVVSNNWHIFDVYRTAFEPRGKLVVDVLNETFRKWGNRLWKFDQRSDLDNLTVNVVTIVRIRFFSNNLRLIILNRYDVVQSYNLKYI